MQLGNPVTSVKDKFAALVIYFVSTLIRKVGVVLRSVRGCGFPVWHCHTISYMILLTFCKMENK